MNYRVVIQLPAQTEIAEIALWISERNPAAGAQWLDGCEAVIASLNKFPERCPLAPEHKTLGREIRQLLYGRYRILFTIGVGAENDWLVRVLHVRHGARDYLRPEGEK